MPCATAGPDLTIGQKSTKTAVAGEGSGPSFRKFNGHVARERRRRKTAPRATASPARGNGGAVERTGTAVALLPTRTTELAPLPPSHHVPRIVRRIPATLLLGTGLMALLGAGVALVVAAPSWSLDAAAEAPARPVQDGIAPGRFAEAVRPDATLDQPSPIAMNQPAEPKTAALGTPEALPAAALAPLGADHDSWTMPPRAIAMEGTAALEMAAIDRAVVVDRPSADVGALAAVAPARVAPAAPYLIQLGAVSSKATALRMWDDLVARHASILGSWSASIQQRGALYLLRTGSFGSFERARAACRRLGLTVADCFPTKR